MRLEGKLENISQALLINKNILLLSLIDKNRLKDTSELEQEFSCRAVLLIKHLFAELEQSKLGQDSYSNLFICRKYLYIVL